MNQLDTDGHQQNGGSDLNHVTLTGISISDPQIVLGINGTLSANILLATRGDWQSTLSGTCGQQTYLIDICADGLAAERLLAIPAGTPLLLLGSLDYLYRADLAQWNMGVRARHVEIVYSPGQ